MEAFTYTLSIITHLLAIARAGDRIELELMLDPDNLHAQFDGVLIAERADRIASSMSLDMMRVIVGARTPVGTPQYDVKCAMILGIEARNARIWAQSRHN